MDINTLLTSARQLLKERTDSLQNDCNHCLFKDHAAPFPALLYCFSTIDLLGSLYGGDAKSPSGISERSKKYMVEVMKYPEEKVELLQKVFRHKIVHLAQPMPSVSFDGKKYSWWLCHGVDYQLHLKIEPTQIKNEFVFKMSIGLLVNDIIDSIFTPNGYLHRLEREQSLQRKFRKAYQEIFCCMKDR